MNPQSLDELFDFPRFRSISADPAYAPEVERCAGWLNAKFLRMGFDSAVHPTKGHPVVIARSQPRSDRRTVLIYGHYDVQPAEPFDQWATPPFEPRLENGSIFARGVADNKGQIMAHILGVEETLRSKGELPVNVIFLIEGEEEIGSQNLEAFLTRNAPHLKPDVIVVSDASMPARNTPSLTYGMRGILALELRVRGTHQDLHSGTYGGIAPNAAQGLGQLLATLHDHNLRIQIPGFYENVRPTQPWEREEWNRLPSAAFNLDATVRWPGFCGEAGFAQLERTWARPTAEINGIGGGYQGKGSKTIIPKEAFAKLTFRLVPNQTPAEIEQKVKAHFSNVCPPFLEIEIITDHGGAPFFCDPNTPDGLAAQRAVKRSWGCAPALVRGGGTISILETFQRIFGVNILLLGLALPDCNAHGPNENFPITNLETGIRMNQALMEELAKIC